MRQIRRAVALLAMAALLLALAGCETNSERSAQLQKAAHRHVLAQQKGLLVGRQSPDVKVLSTASLHDENGTAAVVIVRNITARPLHDLPIAISVTGSGGALLYSNNAPGLDRSLTSIPLLLAHGELTWIDDQVPTATALIHVSARIARGPATRTGPLPHLSIQGVHVYEDPSNGIGAQGTVVNHSTLTQQQLVVFAVGRRGGRIVAAGRAVLPEVRAGESTQFQVFFIGSPRGAQLEVSAPPTTLG